jgi:putative molybdopterin biosynthesis protein
MPRRYLDLISLSKAREKMQQRFPRPDRLELFPLTQAVGRITEEPIYGAYAVPDVNIASMDGYAVRSMDTVGASEQNPVCISTFAKINTGRVIPPGFDAVVMVEETWEDETGIYVRRPSPSWQYIRHAGEDIKRGELILPKGHKIRSSDIGALATYGIDQIRVRSVRVGLIPTGSELVCLGVRPLPGQVVESNTLLAEVSLYGMGAICKRYPIVPDDPEIIKVAVQTAVKENDFVIISAGSSAGTRDFTEDVIASLGEVIFHGVAVKPGKPVMLGSIHGKPVLGIPGHPVAAQTMLREFAEHLLVWWGLSANPVHEVEVRLTQRISSDLGYDEFVPVSIGKVQNALWAAPHARGSGVQMAIVRSNGYIHIPSSSEGIESGAMTRAIITVPTEQLERTILCIGIRDPPVSEISNFLSSRGYIFQHSAAVTINAFQAIAMNKCHIASICIPDLEPLTSSLFTRSFQDIPITRIVIAQIELGLASMAPISVRDLTALQFINRPRDQASRMLLDSLLVQYGISPKEVKGYDQEVKSHEAVASAIKGGHADAGICSAVVTEAAGLKFLPIASESVELIFRADLWDQEIVHDLQEIVRSPEFIAAIKSRGGYCVDKTGTVRERSPSIVHHASVRSLKSPIRG